MHASSLENMQKCYDRYIVGSKLEEQAQVQILDVGGADVNGSYRQIFAHPRFAYTAADIESAPGVHLIFEDPYRIPLDDRSVDIVLSGQMLEHCEFFWLTFAEMVRVLRPGGFILLIAPSSGPEHRYPVDCYRFYPDAYRALARYTNCMLVDVWLDERGPWKDLVGIFQRHPAPLSAEPLTEPVQVDPASIVPGTDEEEQTQGQLSYLNVLSDMHRSLTPRSYIEIGVRHGRSLSLANGPAIGIDPAPELHVEPPYTTRIFSQTSDNFFASNAKENIMVPIDFAFIDGLHLIEAALRDFMNIERLSAPGCIIAIDDILPNHPVQARRERISRVWTGDVWKLIPLLRQHRPDLVLAILDTSPSGCLLVGGLDPANQVLWNFYNPIMREVHGWGDPPVEILERRELISPLSHDYAAFVAALANTGDVPHVRVEALRRLVASTGAQGGTA
ncbi:MAG TPA: class I SAM-dependent methyltransferase [Sphingobium sp.]